MQEPLLSANRPIIEADGTMTQEFRDLINLVARFLPITGNGSPEGVVEAFQFSLYLDTSGSAGSIEYRKMQTDIAGDRSKGWIQV